MKVSINKVLDIFFPQRCIGCENINKINKYGFCESCMTKIILWNNLPSSFIWHLAKYEGPVQKAICDFKYKKRESYARKFANWIYDFIKENDFPQFDAIIPIPLYWKKEFLRGFNQSTLIGMYLSKLLNKELLIKVLVKIRNTISQTNLDGEQRKENVKGSFAIKNNTLIKGKKILLLDDVYTTGATISEGANLLKKNGAKEIIIFTIAKS